MKQIDLRLKTELTKLGLSRKSNGSFISTLLRKKAFLTFSPFQSFPCSCKCITEGLCFGLLDFTLSCLNTHSSEHTRSSGTLVQKSQQADFPTCYFLFFLLLPTLPIILYFSRWEYISQRKRNSIICLFLTFSKILV